MKIQSKFICMGNYIHKRVAFEFSMETKNRKKLYEIDEILMREIAFIALIFIETSLIDGLVNENEINFSRKCSI